MKNTEINHALGMAAQLRERAAQYERSAQVAEWGEDWTGATPSELAQMARDYRAQAQDLRKQADELKAAADAFLFLGAGE